MSEGWMTRLVMMVVGGVTLWEGVTRCGVTGWVSDGWVTWRLTNKP